jgi:hypothetical protein
MPCIRFPLTGRALPRHICGAGEFYAHPPPSQRCANPIYPMAYRLAAPLTYKNDRNRTYYRPPYIAVAHSSLVRPDLVGLLDFPSDLAHS